MPMKTHTVPIMVGDSEKCKEVSDLLLAEHGIYASRSTIRPSRAEPNGRASRRRPITMTTHSLERSSMCGGVSDCHCDTTRSRRSDFGKIRVKCQCEGRLLVGSSVGLLHAASFDICRSTNRQNRCCELRNH